MPTTWPPELSSGPPELPGLSAASVWITRSIGEPSRPWIVRSVAETIPLVSVCARPKGEPIA